MPKSNPKKKFVKHTLSLVITKKIKVDYISRVGRKYTFS